MSFSPDGSTILTVSPMNGVYLWDSHTCAHQASYDGVVRNAVFSQSGDTLVTIRDDNTVSIRDGRTLERRGVLSGHEDRILSVAFSPDGRMIVTASVDETARVWDAVSGEPVGTPLRHDRGNALFSRDGSFIVTSGRDGTARVWDPRTSQPLGEPLYLHSAADFAFDDSGDALLFWTRNFALVLRKKQGAGPLLQALALEAPRITNQLDRGHLEVASLGGTLIQTVESAPVEGDPGEILSDCLDRLALRVDGDGKIRPREFVPSSEEER